MMNDAIALRGVSLSRRTQEEMHYDFKRLFFSVLQNRYRRPSRRRVLTDLDFRVKAGAKVGIIGANGSGKSTLLKVICGILEPTNGSVNVRGTIAPLIELGAGFDTELSVADNIVYYGILLGHSREAMMARMPSILEFAELSDRRKEPVKSLSSGMAARLGFAIATEMRPDILILDEVLSVGDESFRQKCQDRIRGLWDESLTVLVVSHDMHFIAENCVEAYRLDEGRIVDHGPAPLIVNAYLNDVRQNGTDALTLAGYNRFAEISPARIREFGECTAEIDDVRRDPADEEAIEIRGWAALLTPDGLGDDAYLLVGDRHLTRLPFGQPRPDVARTHGDERLLTSGFSARIDMPALPAGEYPLRIVVRWGKFAAVSRVLKTIDIHARDRSLVALS